MKYIKLGIEVGVAVGIAASLAKNVALWIDALHTHMLKKLNAKLDKIVKEAESARKKEESAEEA